ncbi:LruC domain-containing protein [Schleiferia thermophila]|uniref:LruC domain-containing protein n=1 Tax=Schleiferia thermophila TaxID=884107 RepID=A0A369A7A7_9FLAO|nr:LruC domain-containing protein [Schleiferia thermophila]RCX05031.1 LruC domain-containing protein [Schleiferia thermophila]GCD79451.1 LruC domain-containing protein [Schleiferia thermophila]
MSFKTILFSIVLAVALVSCKKQSDEQPYTSALNFDFETVKPGSITLTAKPEYAGAIVKIFTHNPDSGGSLLQTLRLDAQGTYKSSINLPSSLKSVFLKSFFIGLPGDIEIPVANNTINYDFFAPAKNTFTRLKNIPAPITHNGIVYKFIGPFNSVGLPTYLENPGDQLSSSFLKAVNDALPENRPVPQFNPHYIQSGVQTDVQITELADVYVTVVHEGAGYRNVLGFYIYDTQNPPTSLSQIDTITIIFPNYSLNGSGGQLLPGMKVKLGRFPAGKSIGWVLIQNGFTNPGGSATILPGNIKFYSNPTFNPEPNQNLKRHMVMLNFPQYNRFAIGFEDLRRDLSSCDNDFNDAVYFISSNPVTAISQANVPLPGAPPADTDGDGIPDIIDEYPNDATKAFNHYQPFKGSYSSIAFEDLWPYLGDYDFNDLVVKFNLKNILNAQNQIVESEYKFIVDHIGASYKNGFGFQLPYAESVVQSVDGIRLTEGIITATSKGLETNQNLATVIVFDNAFKQLFDTITITIKYNTPQSLQSLNQSGLNFFTFVDGNRGREIHLSGKQPTALADLSLLSTGDDITNKQRTLTYRNKDGFPWAILVSHDFNPPTEKTKIWDAYLHFNTWVNTIGTERTDWYENKPGYRNNNLIIYR